MTIMGLGCISDKETTMNRLCECRSWIDEQLQKTFDNSNADIETKKLLAETLSKMVLYIQECSTAVFNYSDTNNRD